MFKIYKNKREIVNSLIKATDVVLDVGFWGQGVKIGHRDWVHNFLKNRAKDVYGLDLDFDSARLNPSDHYQKANAENFDFKVKFDVIFAGDLIEHLSNPGLFLNACARNLKEGGSIIIITPNCFNLFHLAEKLSKREPTVNKDHVCYFNEKTITRLLEKNGWQLAEIDFLYSLPIVYKASWKKKFLNFVYWLLSKFTTKFMENMVITAKIVNKR
ncbi:MAG TPA: methyltransferase domain-containing protein [Patescibacteria group bacterium]|nr:methyltransferase domain-containing protein [Patescibacteria group bacterium]